MLTPLETELLAALVRVELGLACRSGGIDSCQCATCCARVVIGKAEAQQDVIAAETGETHYHRLAHNDGFHKETPEPNCPACQRIVRLEVYEQSRSDQPGIDDTLHGRSL